jgi:hypothetical protein
VAVGHISPTALLHISGSTGGLFEIDSSTAANILFVTSSGNIGIGTNTPTQKLSVLGNAIIGDTPVSPHGGNLEVYTNGTNSVLKIHEDAGTALSQLHFRVGGNDTIIKLDGGSYALSVDTETTTDALRLLINGNLGIGTTTPNAKLDVSGSAIISGSLTITQGITGSLFGTSSWAQNAVTSSYILNAVSASFASTASYVLNAISASQAATASSADNFIVRGTLTAQTIVAQTITSSTDFVTGSTRFGSLSTNTHQFTGSVSITGSLSNQGTVLITNSLGTGSIGMTSSANSTITLTGFYNTGATNMSLTPGGSDSFIDTYGTGNRLIIRNNSGITLTAYSSATQYMHMTSAGVRIGGNDQTISARLHVSGSDNSLFLINSSTAGSVFYVSGSGNVGIGTTAPIAKLDVSGSGVLGAFYGNGSQPQSIYLGGGELGTLILENQTNGGGDGVNIYTMRGNTSFNLGFRTTSGANGAPMNIGNLSSFAAGNINFLQKGAAKLMIDTSGSVGIGTTAPTTLLHISGSTGGLLEIDSNTAANILYVSSSGIVGINTTSLAYGSAGNSAGKLTINNSSGNNGLVIRNGDGGYQLNIKTTTNDIIGTEFVWYDGATSTFLQYGGSIGARLGLSTIAQFRSNTADSSATIHTGGSTLERLRITSTGNVGIGTTSPAEKVSIVGNLKIITTAAADSAGTASIILNPEVNTPATIQALSNFGPTSGTNYSTGFKFITSNRDASLPNPYYSIDAMSILANGNVGIGTTSPSAKLEVNGNTIISGSLTVITGSSVELRVTNIGVTIGNAITDTHTVTGSLNISGSVTATNFTGSLFGTASWATNVITASYALNGGVTQIIAGTNVTISPASGTGSVTINATGGGGAAFPFTGSALITGSLVITGSTTSTLGFTGSLFGTASWAQNAVTASYALTAQTLLGSVVSASYAATASYATNFYVSGTLNVGNTNIEFQENTNVTSGSWRVISSEPTASYRAAFFDYVMFSGSIARAGTIYSVWSASYAEYYENYTGDVGGSTAGVILQAAISGSNIQLQATASNNAWTIRSLVRML